ncbi:MAG TPA: 1,6-anhydro-N-acetylmuramyl-L-alanine amidase AmpD, partial [Gammaproteobacteria bacterium]|nr:1,6-anhydro-N-acetylmuramyl-L-alanine amidase AmpD [Gammaproteobacteria bacterium]
LADLVVLLKKTYPEIKDSRIAGHSTIAPMRKTDPGSVFDWNLLAALSMKTEYSEENNA